MDFIEKAKKDRYVVLDEKKNQLTYLPNVKTRTASNPEEKVQLDAFLKLIYRYGYPAAQIKVCEPVKIGSSNREADIVVYADAACKSPLIVVECKKQGISQTGFREAVEQGFSYAATTRAGYVWVTDGLRDAFFEVWPKAMGERDENRLPDIPAWQQESSKWFVAKKVAYRVFRLLKHPVRYLKKQQAKPGPVFVESLIYTAVVFVFMLVLSKLAVEFQPRIYQLTKPLWQNFRMHFGWLYNTIGFVGIVASLWFSAIFIDGFLLARHVKRKSRRELLVLAALLFAPLWYMGATYPTVWWSYSNFNRLDSKTLIYLLPFLRALPFQLLLIYAMMWLSARPAPLRRRKTQRLTGRK